MEKAIFLNQIIRVLNMEQMLTIRDVAKMLKLSERSIRERVKRGTIPYHKIDGAIRFKAEDLDEWLQSKKSESHCSTGHR